MDCQEVKDRLPEYLDGELEFEEARRIRSHLTRCYYCTEALTDLKECLTACRHVLRHPYVRDRFELLSAAMHEPEPRESSARFWQVRPSRVVAGRLMAAAAVVVFSLMASAFFHTARSLSEPIGTRAVLNEKPDLGGAVTTVAWNAYYFRSGR